jgi:hypothetical protein
VSASLNTTLSVPAVTGGLVPLQAPDSGEPPLTEYKVPVHLSAVIGQLEATYQQFSFQTSLAIEGRFRGKAPSTDQAP